MTIKDENRTEMEESFRIVNQENISIKPVNEVVNAQPPFRTNDSQNYIEQEMTSDDLNHK